MFIHMSYLWICTYIYIYIYILKRCVFNIYTLHIYIYNTGSPQLESQMQILFLACRGQHRHQVVPAELVIHKIYTYTYVLCVHVFLCV